MDGQSNEISDARQRRVQARQPGAPTGLGIGLGPAHEAAMLIARKWLVRVLVALEAEPLRPFQLAARVAGITPKVLAETLHVAEREQLVQRVIVREADVKGAIGFELTPLGKSLEAPLAALACWQDHRDEYLVIGTTEHERLGA